MTLVAALLAAAAVLVAPPRLPVLATGRLQRLGWGSLASGTRVGDRVRSEPHRPPPHLLATAVGGLGVAVVVGGAAGAVAGVVAAGLLHRSLSRLEPRPDRLRRARIQADLPVAADLLAACLMAGSSPADAIQAVAEAVGGPLGAQLRRVVARLRLGGDPAGCWLMLTDEPGLAPLGWSLARAVDGGGVLAPAVARVADEQRLASRWAAEAAARRVGVLAAAPLGLCFLPAFVLVGIVPVVAGIAAGITVGMTAGAGAGVGS